MDRCGLRLRSARVQQYSPDPVHAAQVADLEMDLGESRRYPKEGAAVFIDAMGFARWPDPAPDWAGTAPVADRHQTNNGLWRLIGGRNALTGRVSHLDNYIVGRAKVIEFYEQLVAD